MPTDRPRHAITETTEVARSLDLAARHWPDAARSRLVTLVLLDWAEDKGALAAQDEAVDRLVGAFPGTSGVYRRDEDWPD